MLDEKIENVSHNALAFITQGRDYLYIYGNASNVSRPISSQRAIQVVHVGNQETAASNVILLYFL